MKMTSSELTVYTAHATVAVGGYRDVVISISSRPLVPGELAHLERAIDTAARAHGSAAFVYVMDPSAGLVVPDDAARREMVGLMRRVEKRLRAVAVVILAGGFSGAVLRGATTSVGLLVRPAAASKVFAEIGEALRWARDQTPPGAAASASIEELQAAYDELRVRLR